MAKSGTTSRVGNGESSKSAETRRILVESAVATLKREGFVGASARAIAEEAGSNQGLIFYHFGSVNNLLLAALDSVSSERLEQYSTLVNAARTPTELFDVATEIFQNDLDAGHMTVLAEMIAGASSTPSLGLEVAKRIEPWKAFAQSTIERSFADSGFAEFLPMADIAHAIVALYLGLEMLSHLDGNREPALNLFAFAKQSIQLLIPKDRGEVAK